MTVNFLNDMQYAFLLGRNSDAPLCGCSCHIFSEYHADTADIRQIAYAWEKLGNRHLILHSVISESGEVTFADIPAFMQHLHIYDISSLSYEEAETKYKHYTKFYSCRNMDIHNGEVFVLHVFLMPDGTFRFCFEGDCIAFDITSYQLFIRDFSRIYNGCELPTLPMGFHPYDTFPVPADKKKNDRNYWQIKSAEFGEFPAGKFLHSVPNKPHFTAHTTVINHNDYSKLVNFSETHQTSIEILLLTLFSKAFSSILEISHFVLNVPLLDRKNLPEEYSETGGEYTALIPSDMQIDSDITFEEQLRKTAENYLNDCNHTGISGIRIQKLLKRNNHYCDYHITFSSHIHIDMNDSIMKNSIGILKHIITQTPRVMMDSEFFLSDGNLLISLVTPDDVLPDGMEQAILHEFILLAEMITKEKK